MQKIYLLIFFSFLNLIHSINGMENVSANMKYYPVSNISLLESPPLSPNHSRSLSPQELAEHVPVAVNTPLPESPRSLPIPICSSSLQELAWHILVVDDDVLIRKATSKILARFGFTTDLVTGGQEAVTAVQEKKYDCVFTDIEMVPMDGFTEIGIIRKRMGSTSPIIIAVTSCDSEDLMEKCVECGADALIKKPISAAKITSTIKRILEYRRFTGE